MKQSVFWTIWEQLQNKKKPFCDPKEAFYSYMLSHTSAQSSVCWYLNYHVRLVRHSSPSQDTFPAACPSCCRPALLAPNQLSVSKIIHKNGRENYFRQKGVTRKNRLCMHDACIKDAGNPISDGTKFSQVQAHKNMFFFGWDNILPVAVLGCYIHHHSILHQLAWSLTPGNS